MSIVAYECDLPANYQIKEKHDIFNNNSKNDCNHLQTTKNDCGTTICDECGLKLEDTLIDNENKYYLASETRYSTKTNTGEKSLYTELEALGFPQQIIELADNYYKQIIQTKIYRSKNHNGIVFACVFNAYSDSLESKPAIELGAKFGLDRKKTTNGLKMFAKYFKHRPEKKYIRPMDLIPQLLYKLKISDVERKVYMYDLDLIYNYIYKSSQHIRTAIPSSAAAGLVYYYLKLKGININRNDFSKIVCLTDITFIRVAREIVKLIGYKVRL
jgi:transcription initiation factor TFIIIB Brf1 subunit/transcription initiation factor TFIIB